MLFRQLQFTSARGRGKVVVLHPAEALNLQSATSGQGKSFQTTGKQDMLRAGKALSEEQWAQIQALHPLGAGTPEDVARTAVFKTMSAPTRVPSAQVTSRIAVAAEFRVPRGASATGTWAE